MTVKQFAALCGCHPQTLRYYDQVDLLKPARVDAWTGYRHYEERQAFLYVKIRSLQAAGCTIEEIKALLDADHPTVCAALDRKVAEQEARLREIQAIRQSYLDDMKTIQEKVQAAADSIFAGMQGYDPETEFGLTLEQFRQRMESLQHYFDAIAAKTTAQFEADLGEKPDASPAETEAETQELLNNPDYALIFERHGWANVKDFWRECPVLEDGREYAVLVHITRDKEDPAFAYALLCLLLTENPEAMKSLSCKVQVADEFEGNRFWLLKRKCP